MYENSSYTPARLIRYGILILIIIGAIIATWYAMTHGGIRVKTTSDSAEIIVSPENDSNTPSAKATGNNLFSVIRTGRYIVTVKDGDKQTRTIVEVTRFNVNEISLTAPDVGFSEAITNISTPVFAVSSSAISLLDGGQDEIASINKENVYSHTDKSISYESAVWQKAGDGYAIGRKSDTNDRVLVKITGNKPQTVATPKPITPDTYLAFYVTMSGEFYLLQDGELFSSNGDGNYQSKGEANKEASILSVSNNQAAFLYRNSEEQCEIQFLNLADKSTKKLAVECIQDPSYSYSAAWSEDSKYLALTTGTALKILNKDLSVQTIIPDYAASNPVWLNSDTLVYTSRNNVWSHTLSTKVSSVVATTPEYVSVQSLRKSDDSDSLYFTGSADNLLTLYRIQKNGDSLSDIQKLSESNMQLLSVACRIRYVNFTKAQLVLQTADSTRSICVEETQNYLTSIGISLSSFQYDIREEYGYSDDAP